MSKSAIIPVGDRVFYRYNDYLSGEERSGYGEIINHDVIIGTDWGYAIKRDSDGEVVYLRRWFCVPVVREEA